MDEARSVSGEPPVVLEINANHRYRAGHMGVLEFRVRNQGSGPIFSLDLLIECPCERSRKKSVSLRTLAPSSEKKPSFQFEPARGGEALLEVELCLETDAHTLKVYRGHASVDIASMDQVQAPSTSFSIDIHDIGKFMGNDLSGILTMAGKELNEDRLRERMAQKEPFWMRVDLDLDEHETCIRQDASRKIICVPEEKPPQQTFRALLESLEPSLPLRAFIYSSPEIRFGRHMQKNDAILRFLPDFHSDERSKTISSEQFVTCYSGGQCLLSPAPSSRAATLVNLRPLGPGERIPIVNGIEIRLGSQELGLRIHGAIRSEDARWKRTLEKIRSFDPGEDVFGAARWDNLRFVRFTNGEEEQYLWLLRKIDLGWGAEEATEFNLGQPANPCARLSFANGRYFLESLNEETVTKAADRVLKTGDIFCLGPAVDILFGRLRFQWKYT